MPQLDIYTFPTQIYTLGFILFIGFLVTTKFLLTAFFKTELLEKEEVYTLDTVFLLQMAKYDAVSSRRSAPTISTPQLLTALTLYPTIR